MKGRHGMKKLILAFIFSLVPTVTVAETLNISGKSYSLMLNDSVVYMSGYEVRHYFTTYDANRYTYPYYYDATHGIIYYSRELKKIGSSYYTDYYWALKRVGEIGYRIS